MLQRLNVLGSVLMIGAHDDDDDTQLLTYLSRELHLRTAYLSLARGTGAQNRIGPERGDAMGVLLTQEALAARSLQNVEQYYTRVFDFGFSKTLRETMSRWDRPEMLSDITWIIRRFRPDVVIVLYSGTPRDGHGNHQASAVLARKAIAAAGDPSQFPEHLKYAPPWSPKRVFERSWSGQPNSVVIDTGGYNANLGWSYGEIASLSRSSFRSQSMGGVPTPGPRPVFLTPLDRNQQPGLLDGVDTAWTRINGGKPIADALAAVLRAHDAARPDLSVPALLAVRAQLEGLRSQAPNPWSDWKLTELDEAILECSGVWLRASADQEVTTPGNTIHVSTTVVSRVLANIELSSVTLHGPTSHGELLPSPKQLPPNRPLSHRGRWVVPAGQPPSQPYWLGRRNDIVALVADPLLIGPAEDPPLLRVRFQFRAAGGRFEITRPVRHLRFEPGAGSSWRPLVVAPPVTVRPNQPVLLFPDRARRELILRLTAHRSGAAGTVRLRLPDEWKSEPATLKFNIASTGDNVDLSFSLTPPAKEADVTVLPVVQVDGRETSLDQILVAYPHIEPKTFFPLASIRLVRAPVRVLAKRVGYISGTGDDVPAAIAQLGCDVSMLSARDLADSDLTSYDAIVLGVRAYNVRREIQTHRDRLRAYVQNGGTLIMQYSVSPNGPNAAVDVPDLGPFPFRLGAGRVTVEDAPVTFLMPGHPVLKVPNTIRAEDFSGWLQERGLHFADKWDPRYETPLETHDPDESPLPGGLLFARYGRGVFVYTAHAWFRQLPAGVPGAYRIFANLLSAGGTGK
jgi:LmbE family N-acetylglucosaminyl deacetylase